MAGAAERFLKSVGFVVEKGIYNKVRNVPVAGELMRERMEDRIVKDGDVYSGLRARAAMELMSEEAGKCFRRFLGK